MNKIQRMIVNEKSLEIKSHGDELLKEVEHFLKTRKQIDNTPSISKVEIELREEVQFLKRVLKKE